MIRGKEKRMYLLKLDPYELFQNLEVLVCTVQNFRDLFIVINFFRVL